MFLIFIAYQKVQKIILFSFILINHLIVKIIIQKVLFYHIPNSLLFSTLNSIVCLVTTHNKWHWPGRSGIWSTASDVNVHVECLWGCYYDKDHLSRLECGRTFYKDMQRRNVWNSVSRTDYQDSKPKGSQMYKVKCQGNPSGLQGHTSRACISSKGLLPSVFCFKRRLWKFCQKGNEARWAKVYLPGPSQC